MAVGGEDKQLAGRIDGGERSNSQATLNRSCCQRLDLVGDKWKSKQTNCLENDKVLPIETQDPIGRNLGYIS